MKTLHDHTIIYDDECPMCDLYTRSFVKARMLDKHGRIGFTKAGQLLDRVERPRACDEIALVNNRTGEVTYGIDSLMRIIGNSFPIFNPLFRNAIFYRSMKKLYAFISYNRKVIIPGRRLADPYGCNPSFDVTYRIIYLLFAWIVTSLILNAYSKMLRPLVPVGNFEREFLICGGQILFQGCFVAATNKRYTFHYLGNMMTISLAGSLLLLIFLPFVNLTHGPFLPLAMFMIVVALMFFEHIRRVKLLELSSVLTATWLGYRVIVLLIIQ
jgi:hypothetical protein